MLLPILFTRDLSPAYFEYKLLPTMNIMQITQLGWSLLQCDWRAGGQDVTQRGLCLTHRPCRMIWPWNSYQVPRSCIWPCTLQNLKPRPPQWVLKKAHDLDILIRTKFYSEGCLESEQVWYSPKMLLEILFPFIKQRGNLSLVYSFGTISDWNPFSPQHLHFLWTIFPHFIQLSFPLF